MLFVWIGAALIALKWLDVSPVGQWSWWWILAPLALAFLWFEVIEPFFGLDKRKKTEDHYIKLRRERVDTQFRPPPAKKR